MAKNLLIRVGVLLLNFGTGVLVARSLGPSGRGEQAVIALWPGFIATMLTLGIPTALNFQSRRNPTDAARLYAGAAVMMLVVGLTASVIGVVAMPYLLHGYDTKTIHIAQLFMLFAPESLVASVARAHLESQGQFTRSTLGLLYPNIAALLGVFLLRITGHLTPVSAALCYMAPTAIQSCWLVCRLWKRDIFGIGQFLKDIRLLLPYGLQCYGVDIINAVSGQMDLVIIVAFLSPAELGLYTVALSVSRIINIIHNSIITILFPRASSLSRNNAIELVVRAARISASCCICVGILFFFVLKLTVPIVYGAEFVKAIPLLSLLIAEAVLGGITAVLFQAFMATGKPAVVTIVQICWTGAAISLLFVFVPHMSIAGAAMALLVAALVRLALVLVAYPLVLGRAVPGLILKSSDFAYVREKVRAFRPVRQSRSAENIVSEA